MPAQAGIHGRARQPVAIGRDVAPVLCQPGSRQCHERAGHAEFVPVTSGPRERGSLMQSWRSIVVGIVIGLSALRAAAQSPDGTGRPLPEDHPIPPNFPRADGLARLLSGQGVRPRRRNKRPRQRLLLHPSRQPGGAAGWRLCRPRSRSIMGCSADSSRPAASFSRSPSTARSTVRRAISLSSDGSRSDAYCSRRFFREHVDQTNAQRQRWSTTRRRRFRASPTMTLRIGIVLWRRPRRRRLPMVAQQAAVAAEAAEKARIAAMKPASPGVATSNRSRRAQ